MKMKRFDSSIFRLIPFILFMLLLGNMSILKSQDLLEGKPKLMEHQGKYKVGHKLVDLIDKSRKEPATKDATDFRHIPIQIWYPANKKEEESKAKYRPRIEAFRSAWGKESVDFMNSVETSIVENVGVSQDGPFHVFVFSHGWSARSSSHTTFLSNLASYGYIVIGINHPYLGKVALSNGTITEPNDNQFKDQRAANQYYAEDVIHVVDYILKQNKNKSGSLFAGKINTNGIVAAGHSSGFPAASNAAVLDKRIKGLISFDSGVPKIVREKGLDVPVLLFRADSSSYTDLFFRGENVHPKGTIYDVDFFRVHRADFYDLVLKGTTHNSVYDEYLFAETKDEKSLSLKNHKLFGEYTHLFISNVFYSDNEKSLNNFQPNTAELHLRIIKGPTN